MRASRKTIDGLLALLAILIASGSTALAIGASMSGHDPQRLSSWIVGGTLGVLTMVFVVSGYRIALQTQRERVARRTRGVMVSAALDSPTRDSLERLLPNLGFNIRTIAFVVGAEELQLWTGIRDPFELTSIRLEDISRWTTAGGEVRIEVAPGMGKSILISISPRFVGRWVVRLPSAERMQALRAELRASEIGAKFVAESQDPLPPRPSSG